MTSPGSAVEIARLRKTYGPVTAVDDVSFSVAEGEIFGILGPNGAGKTTTVECATGLRSPDSGTIRLLGLDPHMDRDEIHEIVGVQLQASARGVPRSATSCSTRPGSAGGGLSA
jgi:ABC-2 type transport system ATP-binding protein